MIVCGSTRSGSGRMAGARWASSPGRQPGELNGAGKAGEVGRVEGETVVVVAVAEAVMVGAVMGEAALAVLGVLPVEP